MTNDTSTPANGLPRNAPTSCPSCGKPFALGIQFRHAIGPGRLARRLARVAVLLGLGTFAYAVTYGSESLGGYGAAGAMLAGLLVWTVCNQVAARCPRSRLLRCSACTWQRELPVA